MYDPIGGATASPAPNGTTGTAAQPSAGADELTLSAQITDGFATPLSVTVTTTIDGGVGVYVGDGTGQTQTPVLAPAPAQNVPAGGDSLAEGIAQLSAAVEQAIADGFSTATVQGIGAQPGANLPPALANLEQVLARALPLLDPSRALVAQQLRAPAALAALAKLIDPAILAGIPKVLAPSAALLAQFVAMSLAAKTPAEFTLLAAQVGTLFAKATPANVLALLAQVPNTALATGSLYGIPGVDPHAETIEEQRRTSQSRRVERLQCSTLHAALTDALPEVDDTGNRYDEIARARLAELAIDPRSGFAPEGMAALEAERRFGLRFARATDGVHEFTDRDGAGWHVVMPVQAERFADLLERSANGANVIVYLLRTPRAQVAALEHLITEHHLRARTAARVLTIAGPK